MNSCHNHQHCINDALKNAQAICMAANVKLTPLREQVLSLIWQNHKLLGAYDLIDLLAEASGRRIAPPTVYRALDFLLGIGIIHRINSLNAYIGCPSPTTKHPSYFLICTQCQTASECNEPSLSQHIEQLGIDKGFSIQQQWLEVLGICSECRATESSSSNPLPSTQ
jgi:Fur family zinc uptake transcriptional regulator